MTLVTPEHCRHWGEEPHQSCTELGPRVTRPAGASRGRCPRAPRPSAGSKRPLERLREKKTACSGTWALQGRERKGSKYIIPRRKKSKGLGKNTGMLSFGFIKNVESSSFLQVASHQSAPALTSVAGQVRNTGFGPQGPIPVSIPRVTADTQSQS